MKPDLRPEWGIIRPLFLYLAVMLALAWCARTFMHMPMYPDKHTPAPVHARSFP